MHRALCTWNSPSGLGWLRWPRHEGGGKRDSWSMTRCPCRLTVSENMLVFSRIHQILKAFLPSCSSSSTCGQMCVVCEHWGAKSLASKMLQGYCSRLTVHCSGIKFTWCYTTRDFLFHIIMYILYAAPLSLFVMVLPQANAAPGMVCVQIRY